MSGNKQSQTIAIALGGSIIVPQEIQINFLKKFRKFILKFTKQNKKFIIVTGGGAIARNYQNAASQIVKLSDEDKDWLGIHATRDNAHLLRTIFKNYACPEILDNPHKKIDENYKIFIGSGWKPGWSTDYDLILLAKRFNADKIIIASKIAYVYDDDIGKNKNAKPIKEITWNDYTKLIPSKWKPGMGAPIDPIAAKLAAKLKMEIIVMQGTNLKNLENILLNKKFKGTIINN
jgi:uridylate kinase